MAHQAFQYMPAQKFPSELFRLTAIIVFIIAIVETNAFSAEDDYLWVEFEDRIKEKNGSIIQLLSVHYGRFPYKKGNLSELENLRAFYTLNEKGENAKDIFYALALEKDNPIPLIRANSLGTNKFTIFVAAEKSLEKLKYYYLAKTSFCLFGKSTFTQEHVEQVSPDKIRRWLHINITPEHPVWPQVKEPVEIRLFFDDTPLAKKRINIVDEGGDYLDIETNNIGSYVYVPPDDLKLRSRGSTAYKQTIVLADETKDDTIHKFSYTLLFHRSRYGNRNLQLGSGILGGAMAIVFMVVWIKRRGFLF